mmetsp:Transcript_11641/g.19508  ORF Transcript_11641/g.19508 Transcript_11641/m.19508 type:complete len:316 (+) Transcript_11641:99-1046(+)
MQSLFPQAPMGGGFGGFGGNAGAGTTPPLVEFKAGKCILSNEQPNGKFQVTADPRRGSVSLMKGSDGLVHFKWTNSLSNSVEDDRIVFPGEYTFKKVKTDRPDDRVYLLKYQGGSQRLMFWLQDKSTEKDEEVIKKMNECLLNPNAAMTAAATAAGAGGAAGAGAGGSGSGVVSPDEWMQMIGLNPAAGGGAAPAIPPSSSSATAPPPAPFGNLDLGSILSTLAANNASAPAAAGTTSVGTAAPATGGGGGAGDGTSGGSNSAGQAEETAPPPPPAPTSSTGSSASEGDASEGDSSGGGGGGSGGGGGANGEQQQ